MIEASGQQPVPSTFPGEGVMRPFRFSGFGPLLGTLLLIATGCQTASHDDRLSELVWRPSAPGRSLTTLAEDDASSDATLTEAEPETALAEATPTADPSDLSIHNVGFWSQPEPAPAPQRPLETVIPYEIPGANAPPITLPPIDPTQPPGEWRDEVGERYPAIPELSSVTPLGENAPVWTLTDLEAMASSNHPALRQAWARGRDRQGGSDSGGTRSESNGRLSGRHDRHRWDGGLQRHTGFTNLRHRQQTRTGRKRGMVRCPQRGTGLSPRTD